MDKVEATTKYERANALYQLKRYAEALELLYELSLAFPKNANVIYSRALCFDKLGRPEKAFELCDRLTQVCSDRRGEELRASILASRDAVSRQENAPGVEAPPRPEEEEEEQVLGVWISPSDLDLAEVEADDVLTEAVWEQEKPEPIVEAEPVEVVPEAPPDVQEPEPIVKAEPTESAPETAPVIKRPVSTPARRGGKRKKGQGKGRAAKTKEPPAHAPVPEAPVVSVVHAEEAVAKAPVPAETAEPSVTRPARPSGGGKKGRHVRKAAKLEQPIIEVLEEKAKTEQEERLVGPTTEEAAAPEPLNSALAEEAEPIPEVPEERAEPEAPVLTEKVESIVEAPLPVQEPEPTVEEAEAIAPDAFYIEEEAAAPESPGVAVTREEYSALVQKAVSTSSVSSTPASRVPWAKVGVGVAVAALIVFATWHALTGASDTSNVEGAAVQPVQAASQPAQVPEEAPVVAPEPAAVQEADVEPEPAPKVEEPIVPVNPVPQAPAATRAPEPVQEESLSEASEEVANAPTQEEGGESTEESQTQGAWGEREVVFPTDRSMGFLSIRDAGTLDEWKPLGETCGALRVPPGKELRLDLSEDGMQDLTPLKALAPAALAEISMESMPATGNSLAQIAHLTGLEALYLGDTTVTDIALAHVEGLSSLKILDLHSTEVTDDGLQHIEGLTALRELILYGCQVTDKGLEHLAGLTSLEGLYLGGGMDISGKGLKHLAGLKSLKRLDLWQTDVDDDALEHLVPLTGLTELSLGGTQVTDNGLGCLMKLRGLRQLNLAGLNLTEDPVAALEKALPECEILGR